VSVNLKLMILEALADGLQQSAMPLAMSFVEQGIPLDVTCGTDGLLLSLSEQGLLSEELKSDGKRKHAWYRITAAGLAAIEELKRGPVVVDQGPRQKAMF
jgi:DNA-binding PadR family transcriptional regulator